MSAKKMDAEGAGNAALNYIKRAFSDPAAPDPAVAHLGLEEVVPCGNRRWRVTVGFTYPWHQQEQQGTNAPRIYKDVIIKDDGNAASSASSSATSSAPSGATSSAPSGGASSAPSSAGTTSSVISMTNRPIYAPKSVYKVPAQDACTVVQSAQPGCVAPAPVSWGDSLRSLYRAFVQPVQSVAGWASFVTLIAEAAYGKLTPVSAFVLFCAVVIGLFAQGRWWLQRQAPQHPIIKKCNCRPRNCRCRRLRRKRIEPEGQASPS